MSQQFESTGLEIAVIGMTGRFPGAASVEELWLKIRDGVDCVTQFSDAELTAAGVDAGLLRRPDFVKAAAVLADVDLFDAEFFGFSPREAELLDPQHRLFLECAWQALEKAGYAGESYKGLIGVCAGVGRNGYLQQNVYTNPELVGAAGVFQTILNNEKDSVALRTAYQLNLGGPSLTIQTACSTSLVAVHVACQNLLAGECDICLAGGVSIALPQVGGYIYSEGLMQSRDGRCRAYDAEASGAVLGRGVGVVVLKRLADAIEDGDSILAVIKGSAVNNDGSSKIGYTAPSIEGQARVIRTAHLRAGVAPETVSLVEGHGTATTLGDPVEVAALNEAFALGSSRPNTCALGSLKSNMGHLDAAAGVAGLIKAILALRHRQLPPSLHFTSPNPKIEFAAGPFYVNTQLKDWPQGPTPRRAGVSSFGMGGTNAHVVVEEAPAVQAGAVEHSRRLLVVSARSRAALDRATDDLAAFLRANPQARLDDVAFTLQVGRKAFNNRRAIVCADASTAVAAIESRDAQSLLSSTVESRDRSFVFMFPGQGAQYPGLLRGLFGEYREFRAAATECLGLLARHMPGVDLRDAMDASADPAAEARLARTDLAQPALFVVEYAMAKQLMSWGIAPSAMIGHSVGELVAACLAGVFSLDEALGLVAARGRLMQALPPGGMMAIPLSHGEAASLVAGTSLSIAAINGPRLSVVAGPYAEIDALEATLASKGLTGARLRTSHAFHSSMMDPIAEVFAGLVAGTKRKAPSIPYVSNVTGTWITASEAVDPAYWAKHLRQPVLFAEGIRKILSDPRRALLEVGPGATLTMLARQNSAGTSALILQTMPRAQEKETDCAVLLGAIARLWLTGVPVDFARVHAGEKRSRIALPSYPFERKRFWVEPGRPSSDTRRQSPLARRARVNEWCYAPAWKASSTDLTTSSPARWLVLVDESPFGNAVVQGLSAHGSDVTRVIAGDRFERRDRNTYSIKADCREDYDRILADLHAEGRGIDRLALLWSIDAARGGTDAGFYQLLFLLQALGSSRGHTATKVFVGTAHARSVTGAEGLHTSDATMLGLCRVVSQEFPDLACSTIDVDPPADREHALALAGRLVRDLTSDAPDSIVAWRGYKRWVLGFDEVAVAAGASPRLKRDGVYLITGGLGRVGLTLARRIASVGTRLVLTSTSPLPPREKWDGVTSGGVLERIRSIQAIERAGASVVVETVDAADREQMIRLVGDIDRRFGRLDGVIHAAGVTRGPSFAPIQQLDAIACGQQFAPKVAGVRALENALAGRSLDFCLLTSSLASLAGGVGFGAYAGANAYLDLTAHVHHARGESWWVSANWEGWNFDGASGAGARLALSPEDGAAAFAHIVSAPPQPQIAVSTVSLSARLSQAGPAHSVRDQRRMLTAYERPNLQNPYMAPASDVERAVAAIWMELLGVDRVGVRDNFFELGGHSLLATQVIQSLRESFGSAIPVSAMFEHPTVESLAQMISGQSRTVAGLTKASGRGERRREALRHLEVEKAIR